jgi:hypothetical protein
MTRVRSLILGGAAAALMAGGTVSTSWAIESGNFTNNLTGASVGLPLGAAPPPGVYSGLESLYGAPGGRGGINTGNQGSFTPGVSSTAGGATKINAAFIGVVPVVWSTGYNIWGGSLVFSAVQAFYTVGVGFAPFTGPAFFPSAVVPVIANTTWGGNLSWNLGGGFFFAAGFAFEAPDGSRYLGNPNPDYWSFEPTWAISYLGNNWVLSANMAYFFNTRSVGTFSNLGGTAAGNGFLNGEEFYLDLTALYKFGKWEIGPVGSLVAQTTTDQPGSGIPCVSAAFGNICGKETRVRAGGLVGYDFGPVDFQVWVTDDVYCADAAGCGWNVWSRLGFRIWGPEAPKPLVAKN